MYTIHCIVLKYNLIKTSQYKIKYFVYFYINYKLIIMYLAYIIRDKVIALKKKNLIWLADITIYRLYHECIFFGFKWYFLGMYNKYCN